MVAPLRELLKTPCEYPCDSPKENMMSYNRVSDASFPDFYWGALHHQSGGFLDGLVFGYLSMGRR